jgi:hypothetical protein
MFGVAGEQIESVRQDGQSGAEGTDRSCRAAGQVEDDAGAEGSADGAAEDGEGRLAAAFGTHQLGDAGQEAVADGEGGLRSDVAGGDAGASCGNHQGGGGGRAAECVLELLLIVWKREAQYCLEAGGV